MKANKKRLAAIALSAAAIASVGIFASACTGSSNFVDGPQYEYRLFPSTDEYEFTGNVTSTVVPDMGITIDGVFDEDFYTGRNWFKGNKITETETGTLEVTTYFSRTGIVVAARIQDSRPAVHSSTIETGNQTCFNCYFAFGDALVQTDGLYEIECTVGNRFKISKFTTSGMQVMATNIDVTPISAVTRVGDVKAGTCYEYSVEYFLPYSLFGRDSRPEKVYLNPTMISASLDEYGQYYMRTWYNFGYEQSPSISTWGAVNQGYVFDENGFVSNSITIQSTGGTVAEEWGYDWCLVGDTVNFYVTPESGKTLSSILVNGVESKDSVSNGVLSVRCTGDIDIVAVFE